MVLPQVLALQQPTILLRQIHRTVGPCEGMADLARNTELPSPQKIQLPTARGRIGMSESLWCAISKPKKRNLLRTVSFP